MDSKTFKEDTKIHLAELEKDRNTMIKLKKTQMAK